MDNRLETYKDLARKLADYENRTLSEREVEKEARAMMREDDIADSDFLDRRNGQ